MPSKTSKQARFMAACAHGAQMDIPCPPPKVSREFNQADKGTGIIRPKPKKKKPKKVRHRGKTFMFR